MLNQMNNDNLAFNRCQGESINFLSSRFHGACGDKPGLGKTRTAILAAEVVSARTGLAICPPGVRSGWLDQLALVNPRCDWHIIGDSELDDKFKTVHLRARYDVVVPDEAHRYKEFESARTMAVFGPGGLVRRGTYKWPLSGTFSPNGRPVEYWPMLKTLHPDFAAMSYAKFTQLYCGAFFDGRAMNVKGASRLEEFKALLDKFIISHTKAQAFPGRSAPLVVRVPVDLSKQDLVAVNRMEREIIGRDAYISATREQFSQLGDSATLRRLLGMAMIPAAEAFVREKLEGVRKVVLFYQHTDVGAHLVNRLAAFKPILYKGGMTDGNKDNARRAFALPAHRVFIAQQQSAGTGINGLQQHSSTAIFAEPDWTPGETEQRIDRLDRMGAESELVTAYQLYARGTMQAAVVGVHDRKDGIRLRLE